MMKLLALSSCLLLAQPDRSLTVAIVGDSTLAPGGAARQVAGQLLPFRLARRGLDVTVAHAALGPLTSEAAERELDRAVLDWSPDLVFVQLGGDDAGRVLVERYEPSLMRIRDRVEAGGAACVLVTPHPLLEKDGAGESRTAEYADAVRRVARASGTPLIDVHAAYLSGRPPGAFPLAELLEDGSRPTGAGHAWLADRMADAVLERIDRGQVAPRAEAPDLRGLPPWVFVEDGVAVDAHPLALPWREERGALQGSGPGDELLFGKGIGPGDFVLTVRMSLDRLAESAASLRLGRSHFGLDGEGRTIYLTGPLFGGVRGRVIAGAERWIRGGVPFTLEVRRSGDRVRFSIDGKCVHAVRSTAWFSHVGVSPHRATARVYDARLAGGAIQSDFPGPPGYTIPLVDISSEADRQVVVDRDPDRYLGHPTTVLLEDGRTILCAYPEGHGKGPIRLKRSEDGGRAWSEPLPVPESFATSKETPTIHRVVGPDGEKRLILFSGLYPIRMSTSEDDGRTWSELEPIFDHGGIVAMSSVVPLRNGDYLAMFHDDGRFFDGGGRSDGVFRVYATRSTDGGLSWSPPEVIATHALAHLCEPGSVRSPDGGTIAVLLRENSRRFNSFVIFSRDEGRTWSAPRQLPAALTGDRHVLRYAPDGRLFATFRDTTRDSPTQGDWVGWVGTWEDIERGTEGQYRVRIMDNHHRWDCAYPGLELLPDDTFVTTTYGHWTPGAPPYIVSVRLRLEELDAKLEAN